MLKLFAGEDTYSSFHAAQNYARDLAGKLSATVVTIDPSELASLSELDQRLEGMSLFQEREVVLLKRPFAEAQTQAAVTERLERWSGKPLVLWHDKPADKRTSLVKSLARAGAFEQFPAGETKPWEKLESAGRWTAARARELGIGITPEQQRTIATLADGDKWIIDSELRKFKLYCEANGIERVPSDAAAALIGTEAKGDIWKFLDDLANEYKAQALTELDKLLRVEDVQYIIAMITRELGLLAGILDCRRRGAPLTELKLKPFVLKKTQEKAARYDWERVRRLYRGLFRLDLAIKQGRVEPEDGLTVYILSW